MKTGMEGSPRKASGPERWTVALDTAAVAGVGLGSRPHLWPTAVCTGRAHLWSAQGRGSGEQPLGEPEYVQVCPPTAGRLVRSARRREAGLQPFVLAGAGH